MCKNKMLLSEPDSLGTKWLSYIITTILITTLSILGLSLNIGFSIF